MYTQLLNFKVISNYGKAGYRVWQLQSTYCMDSIVIFLQNNTDRLFDEGWVYLYFAQLQKLLSRNF